MTDCQWYTIYEIECEGHAITLTQKPMQTVWTC